jgi:glycerophosphoryl diester phosphodiesterase
VNAPADIDRMLALGVDGVISDYPDRVMRALESVR